MTLEGEALREPPQRYVPRVFGFRINAASASVAHLHRREDTTTAGASDTHTPHAVSVGAPVSMSTGSAPPFGGLARYVRPTKSR